MDTTRRDFLRRSAACAAIVGFSDTWLSRQEGAELATSRPARWAACLEQMKKEGKPGLVVRFPDTDLQQTRLAGTLEACLKILRRPEYDRFAPTKPYKTVVEPKAIWVFLGSVVVAMEGPAVAKLIAGAKPNETLILIDENGTRIEGRELKEKDLYEAGELLGSLEGLLSGPGFSRVKERSERAAIPKRAYETVLSSSPESVAALRTQFADRDYLAVLYDHYVTAKTLNIQSGRAEVLGAHYNAEKHPLAGHTLPFGIELVAKGEPVDPCPPCGMAVASPPSRKFVGILQAGSKPKNQ